ncbi:MAG TPA: GNAT family N-acetyltransferase [Chitinophagaceae bacterium]|jgi:peptidyl-dipeptidase Dcp|nr:GNAT family N-acetyltransferase [Chitinophagaceae bacterium]
MTLQDITIRTTLEPGDAGYVIHLHGKLYKEEYDYGVGFETYVAAGFREFYQQYDTTKDRVWIAEHNNRIIGFVLLMHRPDNAAQLRYFLIDPAYRGIGLGGKLMKLFMEFYNQCGYTSCYLWTTSELYTAASLYRRFGFELVEEHPSNDFGKAVIENKYVLKNQ